MSRSRHVETGVIVRGARVVVMIVIVGMCGRFAHGQDYEGPKILVKLLFFTRTF